MQDLLDAQIPAVVLIPLLLGCFALWRVSQRIVHSNEVRRTDFLRLSRKAQEEQDRLERDHEQGYLSHQEYLRQRQGVQQRLKDDYRVDFRSQPVSGYDFPRRVQVEQDYRYADLSRKEDEESIRRRKWAEERSLAEAEEFRKKQAKELSWRKQAEVEELRKKLAQAEEDERRHREAADAAVRMRIAEEEARKRHAEEEVRRRHAEDEVKRRYAEEEFRRRQAEEEARRIQAEEEIRRIQAEEEFRRKQAEEEDMKRRQAALDEINKKAEAEAQAKQFAEEEEARKLKANEIIVRETQDDLGGNIGKKVQFSPKRICVVCQRPRKSRCAKCKSVSYWYVPFSHFTSYYLCFMYLIEKTLKHLLE